MKPSRWMDVNAHSHTHKQEIAKKNKREGDYEKFNLESLIFRIQSGNYWDVIIITVTHFFSMSLSGLILSVYHLFKDSKVTSERFPKLCSSTIVLTLIR